MCGAGRCPSLRSAPLKKPEIRAWTAAVAQPECGLELTCTDSRCCWAILMGCVFGATCPGIWGLIHTRADQASFRRRFFTFRHFRFQWAVGIERSGVIQAGSFPCSRTVRWFRLGPHRVQACPIPIVNTKIEIRKLGLHQNRESAGTSRVAGVLPAPR